MALEFEKIAKRLVAEALVGGATEAEAMVVDTDSREVEVRNGQLESAKRSQEVEVGLRVLVGSRQACVSGSNVSRQALLSFAQQAVTMAHTAPEDPFISVIDGEDLHLPDVNLEASDINGPPSLNELKEKAAETEAAALSVPGVSQPESTGANSRQRLVFLESTCGSTVETFRTTSSIFCSVISGGGLEKESDYCYESRVMYEDIPTPSTIGTLAGERAVARVGSKRPPTGAYPVLFDERVSNSLMMHLASAINGSSVVSKTSWLIDALGEQVLPSNVSLIEEPHLKRHTWSLLYDAEFIEKKRRHFVEDGILKSWILDKTTSRKLRMETTGNAQRRTTTPPFPAVTNMVVPDGEKSRDELIKDMGTGLIVTSMIGTTINPVSGDYSRGGLGFWVENGEITVPVSEFTIAGNLREFLKTIIPANDSKPNRQYRVPSLLVEGLMIGGQ